MANFAGDAYVFLLCGRRANNAYLMLEKSKLYKRRQDTSDLPYEAEGLLGYGHHFLQLAFQLTQHCTVHPGDGLLHAGALGLLHQPGDPASSHYKADQMPEKKISQKKNLRRWLSSWPVYIIGKARQGLSLAHLPVGTVVSTARLGDHSVGKTLAFCPLCLKYFSSGHSHSQYIWNRRWHWFGSSCAVHYVHHHTLLKWYRDPRHLISSWPSSSLKHNRDS